LPAAARNILFQRVKGREYSMIYRGPGFLAFILLALLPTPVEFTDGREGGGGGEAKSYNGEKA
jgi:hypothetical protein